MPCEIQPSIFLDKTRLTCVKQDLHLLKTFTTSILELCAATIASQQDQYLRRELQLPCEIQPSIFLDKTRLTCVKQDLHLLKTFTTSILELCAATIASQQDQYLRRELQLPCEIQPSIFLDKTRLTCVKQDLHLLKTFTISRIELCAATIASQQDRYLRCELQLPCEIQLSVFLDRQHHCTKICEQ